MHQDIIQQLELQHVFHVELQFQIAQFVQDQVNVPHVKQVFIQVEQHAHHVHQKDVQLVMHQMVNVQLAVPDIIYQTNHV